MASRKRGARGALRAIIALVAAQLAFVPPVASPALGDSVLVGAPNSEVRNNDTAGVLKLTLRSGGYDWQFLPEAGRSFTDAGTGVCHGFPPAAG